MDPWNFSEAWKLAGGELVALSEQQLVDCAKNGAMASAVFAINDVAVFKPTH